MALVTGYFVGIGAPRAGTTWLGEYFSKHPQVCFSPIKELHFFDTVYRPDLCSFFNADFVRRLKRAVGDLSSSGDMSQIATVRHLLRRVEMASDHSLYRTYFEELVTDEKVFGEISPAYILLDREGFSAIVNMFPGARFLLVLRNPVDRYWSHLRMIQQMRGAEHFSAAEQFLPGLEDPKLTLRSDYERTLKELLAVVPESRVAIVFHENLFGSLGDRVVGELTEFLGVDHFAPDLHTVINAAPGGDVGEADRMLAVRKFRHVYRFIHEFFSGRIPDSWAEDLDRVQCQG